jgi:hypothetical protein
MTTQEINARKKTGAQEKSIISNQKKNSSQIKKTKGEADIFDRAIWNYMKNHLNLSEIQILETRLCRCPAKVNNQPAVVFRSYDVALAAKNGITVSDYEILNSHPELVRYEGYHVKGKDGEIVVIKKDNPQISFIEQKINDGVISEVGVVIEKTGAAKFWSGFGRFLMMGGFLIILVLGVGIAIAISMLVGN